MSKSAVTYRQRLEEHTADPPCQSCHRLVDPIGFGFEHFDAAGRYRTLDNGAKVDARGSVNGVERAFTFVGAPELGAQLAASCEVQRCVALQLARQARGMPAPSTKDDAVVIDQIAAAFAASGLDLRELLVAITQSGAFIP